MCLNPKEGLNNQSCDKFVQDYCKGVLNMGENMIRETIAKSQKNLLKDDILHSVTISNEMKTTQNYGIPVV